MATEHGLDRNAIFEKFASLRRMHMEVGKQQSEDYQKRLEKLKEEESNYMSKLLSQTSSARNNENASANRNLTSARRDLFLTSNVPPPINKPTHRLNYENVEHDWNLDDDFQPLNITDNEMIDDRRSAVDDDADQPYLTAFHQLLQTQQGQALLQQQQHHHHSQEDQENMLSTILEASCEDTTPMTSLVDVHQRKSPEHIEIPEHDEDQYYMSGNDDDDDDGYDQQTARNAPTSVDDIPVCTAFSKNENLKYNDYVAHKLQAEKDQAFGSQSSTVKEKRPFLKRRQGLAHYQAPPKRRQSAPKLTETKNETQKRPTSASNFRSNSGNITNSTVNNLTQQRSRSNSASNRQTVAARPSTKAKPTASVKKATTTTMTSSNLLGQVDLDDDEDHQVSMKKLHTPSAYVSEEVKQVSANILQPSIESKWNLYRNDNHEQNNFDDEPLPTNNYGRQRTSSHHSDTQTKRVLPTHYPQELDEFEKLEQYAEEHPSMISTASYVDQVVLKDHQIKDISRPKLFDQSSQRLTRFNDDDEDDELVHREDKSEHVTSSNRIRQRKVKPLRNKIEPIIPASEDDENDDDDENHRWDDVGVAKVIPINGDEYNSDSGTSSLKIDLQKQYQQKKDSARSSDFGDDQSWGDRVSQPTSHNTLMLKTFPGLRQTTHTTNVPFPAQSTLPPPPPPSTVSTSNSEPNQNLSRLMREKSKELEKQIEIFQKENAKLESLCNERNMAIKKLKQDRDEFEKTKQKENEEFQQMKEEEMRKLKQEKRIFEQHRQQLRDHPDKREREEIETLKKQVLALQDDLKQRETRWSANINRLKERIETLEYENAELKQEKDIVERKRLELMHQIQQMNSKTSTEDLSSSMMPRKSVPEQNQNKRAKSIGPTSKTQSQPKTLVVKNTEVTNKPKVVSNGRRTPTNTIGVNGIKNNIDTSRKLSSTSITTKRSISNSETISIIPTERVDSGNGESDEESHFLHKPDVYVSPSLTALTNSEYPRNMIEDDDLSTQRSTTLDYRSMLTMATRTSSSATTILKQHQENLSIVQPIHNRRSPALSTQLESIHSIPRASLSSTTKTLTFKENMPAQHHSDSSMSTILDEIRHQDGRIERIKSDSSKTILFPNGSRQEIHPDGQHIRVYFYNGDYKEKFSDGRCIYKYASTNTTETEYPDGMRICEFPNGQIEKHFPDGRQEHTLPDRTKNIYLTDGTVITLKTNGEKFIQHTNQTKEIHTDTYKRKIFPNGSVLTVFNTGEQEVRYPNGKVKLKDANGNVIMEKKNSAGHQ